MRIIVFILTIIISSCHLREEPIININDTPINDTTESDEIRVEKRYKCIKQYTSLSKDNDNAIIILPESQNEIFYTIFILQGSDLPKENYESISTQICEYGFIVVVFDHYKESFSGKHLYCEQNAVNNIFQKVKEFAQTEKSPLYNCLNTNKFIILGHSYGAACGLFMIGDECKWPFCSDSYKRPIELSGGIFYGISLKSPIGEKYYQINNENIPILLIAGDNDGAIKYEYAEKTFDSIKNPPKIFVRLKGANHYAINDSNPPDGADADKNIQILDQKTGIDIISLLSVAFITEFVIKDIKFKGIFDKISTRFKDYIEIKKLE